MESELLEIFDEHSNPIGEAPREVVHKVGHWHETFHCWFIGRENGIDYIYFQIRSKTKKDFPNLLDITAAGHLLADETVNDGIREIKEELGIDVSFNELTSLGIVKDRIIANGFIDKEFGHVFLFQSRGSIDDYTLQKEEVSGIVKTEFNSFHEFCLGKRTEIKVDGFEMNEAWKKILVHRTVGKKEFVPHEESYLESVVKLISENIIE